jgi:hypothetical protein
MNSEETAPKTPTVFISYSWDNEAHKEWVLNLANRLTEEGGAYVILDRYDLTAGKAMTHFMEKAVNLSDKVLLIMTPNYKIKADNRIGGVGYEYSMVSQELYEKQDNNKFIPIRRLGKFEECAPSFLKQYVSHDMTNDPSFEMDLKYLIRIIYDEPEIKRPTTGARPSFVSAAKKGLSTQLIDEKVDLITTKMKTYAKWTFEIQLRSLAEIDKSSLFKYITSNILVDKDSKHVLPFVLGNNYKVSHHPEIIYDIPLRNNIAYNHLLHEKIKIDKGVVRYEFVEYSDHDFWLLYLSQPFSTLFYLVVIINNVHRQTGKAVDMRIDIKFNSDKRALLYPNHSPFKYKESFQTMGIPDSAADIFVEMTQITNQSVFELFERLYSLFTAENQKSIQPFVKLDKEHFDMLVTEFL